MSVPAMETPAASVRPDGRVVDWRLVVLVLFNVGVLAWIACRPGSARIFTGVANVLYTVGPLAAAVWGFTAARRAPNRQATASWVCLSLGVLGYVVGQGVWTYDEVVLHQRTPFPSLADVGFCAAYPFLFAGVALLPSRPIPLVARWRVLLDSLTSMAALVAFSWFFILAPTLAQGDASLLARILGPFYPLCDLALLFCVLMLMARGRAPGTGPAVLCVAGGLLSIIWADTAFAFQTLRDAYATGAPSDLGWTLGYMLVGLGAWHVRNVPAADAPGASPECCEIRSPSLVQSLLPYALMPPAIGLLCFVYAYGGHGMRAWGVYVAFGLLALLVLARQFFVVWENQGLYLRIREAFERLEEGNRSLQAANHRLEQLATTDGMTDLPNHRTFQERLRAELTSVRPIALLLLDVDRFKQYNDAFGHPAGDDVLRRVASLIRSAVRESDLPARYGGEEFAVILPAADAQLARNVAERIRTTVAGYAWPHAGVTVSIGVACASGTVEAGTLIDAADRALYAAKSDGRDRVTMAPSDPALTSRSAA